MFEFLNVDGHNIGKSNVWISTVKFTYFIVYLLYACIISTERNKDRIPFVQRQTVLLTHLVLNIDMSTKRKKRVKKHVRWPRTSAQRQVLQCLTTVTKRSVPPPFSCDNGMPVGVNIGIEASSFWPVGYRGPMFSKCF